MTGHVSTGTWTVIVGTGAWGEASASFPDDAIVSLGYDSEGGKRYRPEPLGKMIAGLSQKGHQGGPNEHLTLPSPSELYRDAAQKLHSKSCLDLFRSQKAVQIPSSLKQWLGTSPRFHIFVPSQPPGDQETREAATAPRDKPQ
jgi:hypothetical protein